jgi:hypothetical protein
VDLVRGGVGRVSEAGDGDNSCVVRVRLPRCGRETVAMHHHLRRQLTAVLFVATAAATTVPAQSGWVQWTGGNGN